MYTYITFMSKQNLAMAFVMALVISLAMGPVAIKLAPKIGAMDIPKDNRRMHTKAMPRFGGLAVFTGTMVPLVLFLGGNPSIRPVIIGGTLIYILGVLDDLMNLPAKLKFGYQLAVAALMYYMGLRIKFITNYFADGHINFGVGLCFLITVLWIVGITNTINLIDGLDGLADGTAMISAFCIAYVAYIHGSINGMMIVCMAMLCVAGACLGLLPYNFYPAKIFMGDGGSLFLGFMMASLSVVGPLKRSTIIAVIVPVLVLGIPIFDTAFAILRRLINHRPIMEADKGHLHHRLMQSGYGMRRAVLMLYGISGIMGMAAVLISRELYKDAFVLMLIACVYLYVFLTDANNKMPRIKAVNIAQIEREEKRMAARDAQKIAKGQGDGGNRSGSLHVGGAGTRSGAYGYLGVASRSGAFHTVSDRTESRKVEIKSIAESIEPDENGRIIRVAEGNGTFTGDGSPVGYEASAENKIKAVKAGKTGGKTDGMTDGMKGKAEAVETIKTGESTEPVEKKKPVKIDD